jgi:hypothetical protein
VVHQEVPRQDNHFEAGREFVGVITEQGIEVRFWLPLLVRSLTSAVCSWFRHFVAIQGTSVLAQTLTHISRKGNSRYIFME